MDSDELETMVEVVEKIFATVDDMGINSLTSLDDIKAKIEKLKEELMIYVFQLHDIILTVQENAVTDSISDYVSDVESIYSDDNPNQMQEG